MNNVVGWTAWDLNGENETAWCDDNPDTNNILDTTVGFSITAWIKVSDFSQHEGVNRRILAKTDDEDNAYAMFVTETNKAVVSFKHDGIEYKVETPATLTEDTWYFIAATFKATATKEAKIYLNGIVSTTSFASSVTYPNLNYIAGTNLQIFGNGIERLINPQEVDLPPPWDFDTGAFSGEIRDIRVYREKILTQQEITNFNTNRTTITAVDLGESHIAGFVFCPSDLAATSSFTSESFTSESFNL